MTVIATWFSVPSPARNHDGLQIARLCKIEHCVSPGQRHHQPAGPLDDERVTFRPQLPMRASMSSGSSARRPIGRHRRRERFCQLEQRLGERVALTRRARKHVRVRLRSRRNPVSAGLNPIARTPRAAVRSQSLPRSPSSQRQCRFPSPADHAPSRSTIAACTDAARCRSSASVDESGGISTITSPSGRRNMPRSRSAQTHVVAVAIAGRERHLGLPRSATSSMPHISPA